MSVVRLLAWMITDTDDRSGRRSSNTRVPSYDVNRPRTLTAPRIVDAKATVECIGSMSKRCVARSLALGNCAFAANEAALHNTVTSRGISAMLMNGVLGMLEDGGNCLPRQDRGARGVNQR